ncbi:amylopectin binding protein [Aureococcus anophagefferens]|nr:amylopectin binding protein [Aureococcus anophagefferens]
MAVNGDVVVLGGDRASASRPPTRRRAGAGAGAAADAAPFRNGATPPTAEVNGVALDGGAAWAGGGDGFARLWDLEGHMHTRLGGRHGRVRRRPRAGAAAPARWRDRRAAACDADAASLPAGARGWCGAVHVDPTATWVTVAGGLDADAAAAPLAPQRRAGGWLATLHAPTGAVVRGGATPAAVRCMSADESTLITGGDEAAVSFWSPNAAQAGCAPRRRQRVDVPAVYALCVAHDLPDLLEDCGIADDDDLGASAPFAAPRLRRPHRGRAGNRKYQREGVGGGEQAHRDGAPGRDYRSPGVGASPGDYRAPAAPGAAAAAGAASEAATPTGLQAPGQVFPAGAGGAKPMDVDGGGGGAAPLDDDDDAEGKHAFKFVVDDECAAPDQPTVADIEGRINNFIDVSDFDAYTGDENFLLRRTKSVGGELYTREIPDLDEYTKDPPPLPPHLRHIILNKAPPSNDPNALPVPQHVALNHLYCTAIKDGMMVLGVTLRYRQKACTTVYSSCS